MPKAVVRLTAIPTRFRRQKWSLTSRYAPTDCWVLYTESMCRGRIGLRADSNANFVFPYKHSSQEIGDHNFSLSGAIEQKPCSPSIWEITIHTELWGLRQEVRLSSYNLLSERHELAQAEKTCFKCREDTTVFWIVEIF